MVYERTDLEIAEQQLEEVFKQIKGEVCLLGGWATYHIVNKNFEKDNGRTYIGSRDIDLGFHIDKDWSEEQLKQSDFCKTLRGIEGIGFRCISFRLVKDFERETGRELTPEESKTYPQINMINLYVDPIVDYIHPKIKPSLGYTLIDEPLFSLVFTDKHCTVTNLFNVQVFLPKPYVLLAMKLNSVINRDKEHKRIKDIADIYALLWYSDIKRTQLKTQLFSIYPKENARKRVGEFTPKEIDKVSGEIGISSGEIKKVLTELRLF